MLGYLPSHHLSFFRPVCYLLSGDTPPCWSNSLFITLLDDNHENFSKHPQCPKGLHGDVRAISHISLFSGFFFSFSCLTEPFTCQYGTLVWGMNIQDQTSGWHPLPVTAQKLLSSLLGLMLTRQENGYSNLVYPCIKTSYSIDMFHQYDPPPTCCSTNFQHCQPLATLYFTS